MSTASPSLATLEANLTSTLGAKIRDFAIFMLSSDGRVERKHYDVLITDYDLPGMDGIELARRAKLSQPELKIVIASGYGHLEEADAIGAITLPKPFSPANLKRILA